GFFGMQVLSPDDESRILPNAEEVGPESEHAGIKTVPVGAAQTETNLESTSGNDGQAYSEGAVEPPDSQEYRQFKMLFDEISASHIYDTYHATYDHGITRARSLLDELQYQYKPGELSAADVDGLISKWAHNVDVIENHLRQMQPQREGLDSQLARLHRAFATVPADAQQRWLSRLPRAVEGATLDGARLLGKPPARPLDEYQQVVNDLRQWEQQARHDLLFINAANAAYGRWREVDGHNESMRKRAIVEQTRDSEGRPLSRLAGTEEWFRGTDRMELETAIRFRNAHVDRRDQRTRDSERRFLESVGARRAINGNDAEALLQQVTGEIGEDLRRWLSIGDDIAGLDLSKPEEAEKAFRLKHEQAVIENEHNLDRRFFERFRHTLASVREARKVREGREEVRPVPTVDNDVLRSHIDRLMVRPAFDGEWHDDDDR
ncbi:MAG: hypothetical protein WD468_03295, partial [Pirellulales bacterium]